MEKERLEDFAAWQIAKAKHLKSHEAQNTCRQEQKHYYQLIILNRFGSHLLGLSRQILTVLTLADYPKGF